METSIIVPTRNEESCIGKTLTDIFNLTLTNFEVLVVDGASTDRTTEIAKKYSVRIIKQPAHALGKGNGLRLGFRKAKGRKIVWVDADDTYPIQTIPRIIRELDRYDVVTYSRSKGKEHMPKFNRFGNWLFKVLIKTIYGFKGNDPCTGLYGTHKKFLRRMHLNSTHFAIEPEISIKAGRMKLRTLDIPIRYRPRIGQTKLNPIKVGFEDMWTIIKHIGWQPR